MTFDPCLTWRVARKSPMQDLSNESMGCGVSEMVNFMAVTTVVRRKADCESSARLSSGRSLSGWIRHSFPRHSATTLRVPKKGAIRNGDTIRRDQNHLLPRTRSA